MAEASALSVKTNIITGFLGAGKSTNILNVMSQKPKKERWALLVNEFGEVGIDGTMLSQSGSSDIFVREVPGGCMCCSSGIPLHMALNMLLARAKPDRLIIEPSGLGHPRELIEALTDQHYSSLLSLGATITLIDARKISDSSYTKNPIFKQQVEVADVVFASKSDLYEGNEIDQLKKYLDSLRLVRPPRILGAPSTRLSLEWLEEISVYNPIDNPVTHEFDSFSEKGVEHAEEEAKTFPAEGFLRFKNLGKEFESYGWIFRSSFVFDDRLIASLFGSASAERIKATLRTNNGPQAYNFSGDGVDRLSLKDIEDSRIEVIAKSGFPDQTFEEGLLHAICV